MSHQDSDQEWKCADADCADDRIEIEVDGDTFARLALAADAAECSVDEVAERALMETPAREKGTSELPCPFCGGDPVVNVRASARDDSPTGEFHTIACFCGGYSARAWQQGSSREEVLDRWNSRSYADDVRDALAALLEAFPDLGRGYTTEPQQAALRRARRVLAEGAKS